MRFHSIRVFYVKILKKITEIFSSVYYMEAPSTKAVKINQMKSTRLAKFAYL
jgi:hypothetical protein